MNMNIFKVLGLISQFKDVKGVIKQETGQDRKWYSPWSRTAIGAVVALGAAGISAFAGVDISQIDTDHLDDSLTAISAAVPVVYGAALSIYGLVCKIANLIKGDPA